MPDDVRVKLSAEGVQEVVDAMKRIRDEAKQTGEEGGKSFAGFKEAVGELGKELIGFVALEKVVEGVKELFTEVFSGALQLDKLSKTTGLSTDSLQALGTAAEETRVSQESLNKGVETFTRNVGLAEGGSKKAAQGFSDLGVKVSDLKNLSPDKQFQLIAEKLAGVEDSSKRAAIGSQIFGRNFLEIAPAIVEVGEKGIDPFIEKMKELGVYLDGDAIRQMTNAKAALHEIGEETKGLATQFLVGLMPAATQAMDELLKATSGPGVNGFKMIGETVGWVIKLIVEGFRVAGNAVGEFAASITGEIGKAYDVMVDKNASTWQKIKAAASLNTVSILSNAAKGSFDATSQAAGDLWNTLKGGPGGSAAGSPEKPDEKQPATTIIGGVDQNTLAIARARLAFLEAQLAAEQKIFEAHSKLREAAEKQDYDSGQISLDQYFRDRQQILQARFDEELSILQRRRSAIASLQVGINDPAAEIQKKQQLAQIDGEIAVKQIERQTALSSLVTEQANAQRQLYQESLKAEEALYKIQGDRAAAAKLALQQELAAMDQLLRKGGVSDADRTSALGMAQTQGQAKIDYDKAKADADATMKQLNTDIAAIQDKVKDGTLFPIQGEQQIIDLEKQRLPVLQETAARMADLAKQTGDATTQAQADEFGQKIKQIGVATDEAGQEMSKLKQTAEDAFQSGLGNMIEGLANGTTKLSDSFRKLGNDIANMLIKVETQFLAKKFVQWLENGFDSKTGGLQGLVQGGSDASKSIEQVAATKVAADTTMTASGATAATASTATQVTAATTTETAWTPAATVASIGSFGSAAAIGLAAVVAALAFFAGRKMATGGHVSGPGTGTSDDVPAMLSDGEFVVNASATNKPGVLQMLHAINGTPGYAKVAAPGVRKYADGGPVVAGAGIAQNTYHVDASEVPHHIIQQAVDKAVLNVIAKNPVRVRNSIG